MSNSIATLTDEQYVECLVFAGWIETQPQAEIPLHITSIRIIGGEGRTDDNWYDETEELTLDQFNAKMNAQAIVINSRDNTNYKTDFIVTMSDGDSFRLTDLIGTGFMSYNFIANRIAYQKHMLKVYEVNPGFVRNGDEFEKTNEIIAEWEAIKAWHAQA